MSEQPRYTVKVIVIDNEADQDPRAAKVIVESPIASSGHIGVAMQSFTAAVRAAIDARGTLE